MSTTAAAGRSKPPAAAVTTVVSNIVQAHIFVSGKVQGVFYRKNTSEVATRLLLAGWVRNLEDGRVEIMAQGPERNVKQLEQWCHKGPPKAKVVGVATDWSNDIDPTLQPFAVQR